MCSDSPPPPLDALPNTRLDAGKLVLPARGSPKAVAVWIEGSNNNPASDDSVWQYQLANRGVGVFVYDKRGTLRFRT